MAIYDLLLAYRSWAFTDIGQETTPNSVDPDLVSQLGTDLADILMAYLPLQNRFLISAGTAFPIGGADTDLYYRTNIDNFQILRNIEGTWTLLATIPFQVAFPNGILVGLRVSLFENVATVSPGAWAINGARYSIDTQTEFTLVAADPDDDRWDLIYADEANTVHITTGTPLSSPVKPALPANTILVDYIYVPAVGQPYPLAGQVISNVSPAPIPVPASAQDGDGKYTLVWNANRISQFGVYGRFAVEMADTYQEVPIKVNKDISTNNPTSYEFSLSGVDSLIHII